MLIRELEEERDRLYQSIKDLTTIDSVTTDIYLGKMKKINSEIRKLSDKVNIDRIAATHDQEGWS